jgi:O-antigen/teichoic acid export membrane protein
VGSDKPTKQLTKNVFSLTVVQIATYILPLISVPVISRIIGPGKYGTINFAAAFIVYFNLLISYSFDFTATRKIAKEPKNEVTRNTVFTEVFYTQCFLFIVATLAFVVSLFIVPELKANPKVFIYSYFVCVAALFTQNWLFQAMQDLSKVALFNIASRLLFTIAILVVVRKNDDYIWQPFLIGLIQTGIAIWSFVWAYKHYNIKLVKLPFKRVFQVLSEDKIVFFSLIFVNFYTSTNTVILGFYQNADQVGYYTAALRLILIAQSVLAMPMAQAFYPYVGQAFSLGREQGLAVVQKIFPIIMIFIGTATVSMLVLGPFVIKAFYGEKFAAAIPVFQILSIVPLLFSLNNLLGVQIMMNLGMDKSSLKITASAGILSVILNLLMVKHWGYLGSTINLVLTELFLLVVNYILLYRKGLNVINTYYFRFSVMKEYLQPLKNKFFLKK